MSRPPFYCVTCDRCYDHRDACPLGHRPPANLPTPAARNAAVELDDALGVFLARGDMARVRQVANDWALLNGHDTWTVARAVAEWVVANIEMTLAADDLLGIVRRYDRDALIGLTDIGVASRHGY